MAAQLHNPLAPATTSRGGSVFNDRQPLFRRLPQPLRGFNDLDGYYRARYESFARDENYAGLSRMQRATRGQQFRVGNIGQNGTLYLRPIGRPNPQSTPTPPMTPPFVQVRDPIVESRAPTIDWQGSVISSGELWSQNSPEPLASAAGATETQLPSPEQQAQSPLPTRSSRPRAHTVDTVTTDRQQVRADTRASRDVKRSKSQSSVQLLEVAIPHYRLGTPNFTTHGSPVLNSSLYVDTIPSEGQRTPRPNDRTGTLRYSGQFKSPLSQSDSADMARKSRTQPRVEREALRGQVRFSATTGQILAATPSGLIAQITSPNLLDYELLSDFFLTFRSYLRTSDLADFLITRLHWAVDRQDDFGSVVRVRTFVALRHWILNYFVDDFAADYSVRVQFCKLVNNLSDEVRLQSTSTGGDLKVVGELKKCWRRTCALYWDIPDHKTENPITDILPGGLLGSREASVEGPIFRDQNRISSYHRKLDAGSFGNLRSTATYHEPVAFKANRVQARPASSYEQSSPPDSRRDSDDSTYVDWCSMPRNAFHKHRSKAGKSGGPRPAKSSVSKSAADSVSYGEKGISSLKKPSYTSMGLPEDEIRAIPAFRTSEELNLPFPGSLIRGVVLEPKSPQLEKQPSIAFSHRASHPVITTTADFDDFLDDLRPSAGPGVRKLFNPVRKALGTKKHPPSSYHGANHANPARRRSSSGSSAPRRSHQSGNPEVRLRPAINHGRPRVDLLSVQIYETFTRIVREEQDAQVAKELASRPPATASFGGTSGLPSTFNPLKGNPVDKNEMLAELRTSFPRPIAVEQKPKLETEKKVQDEPQTLAGMKELQAWRPQPEVAHGQLMTSTYQQFVPFEEFEAQQHISNSKPRAEGLDEDTTNQQHSAENELDPNSHGVAPTSDTQHPIYSSNLDDTEYSGPMQSNTTTAFIQDPFYLDCDTPRRLKRQPGGDLRTVEHVRSLIGVAPPESLSSSNAGSSIRLRGNDASGVVKQDGEASDPIEPVEKSSIHSIQILPTPPVQAFGNGRSPSFDLQAAKLAQLPDDQEDDGGIESALRKLEGLIELKDVEIPVVKAESTEGSSNLMSEPSEDCGHEHREQEAVGNVMVEPPTSGYPIQHGLPGTTYDEKPPETENYDSARDISRASASLSDDSYCSVPLLQRGPSYMPSRKRKSSWEYDSIVVSHGLNAKREPNALINVGQPRRSIQAAPHESEHLGRVTNDNPATGGEQEGFDIDDNASMSSEDTVRLRQHTLDDSSPSTASMNDEENPFRVSDILPHPFRHPETPIRNFNVLQTGSHEPMRPAVTTTRPRSPPKHIPLKDRVDFYEQASIEAARSKATLEEESSGKPSPTSNSNQGPAHYPFILDHDAATIAQQLTLVEKDALGEVDWRELIELRWRQAPKDPRNWVEHLKAAAASTSDSRLRGGVDLCISRFNIMVKWVASEIVLTEDITERAACITKYIHIAQYARRLRNWATMFQITTALVSSDITRLTYTWDEVSNKDRATLADLEVIIMPTRNFAALRQEMEQANDSNTDTNLSHTEPPIPGHNAGCIPFLGIYTHDLISNAQKPAFIERLPDPNDDVDSSEPLVNFERLCTAAGIVKDLLRMMEASARYAFKADFEVLGRCLWMAALGDGEIERRSRELEP